MTEELDVRLRVALDAVELIDVEPARPAQAALEIDVRLDEHLRTDRSLEEDRDRGLERAASLHACRLCGEGKRRRVCLEARRHVRETEARVVLREVIALVVEREADVAFEPGARLRAKVPVDLRHRTSN